MRLGVSSSFRGRVSRTVSQTVLRSRVCKVITLDFFLSPYYHNRLCAENVSKSYGIYLTRTTHMLNWKIIRWCHTANAMESWIENHAVKTGQKYFNILNLFDWPSGENSLIRKIKLLFCLFLFYYTADPLFVDINLNNNVNYAFV